MKPFAVLMREFGLPPSEFLRHQSVTRFLKSCLFQLTLLMDADLYRYLVAPSTHKVKGPPLFYKYLAAKEHAPKSNTTVRWESDLEKSFLLSQLSAAIKKKL